MSTAVIKRVDVNKQISILNKELSEIKTVQNAKWLTPGKVSTVGGIMDLRTETDMVKIARGYANIIHQSNVIEEAYRRMGIDEYPAPIIDGSPIGDWDADFKLKGQIMAQKTNADEIISMKNEWEKLRTDDEKRDELMKKMEKFTSKKNGNIEEKV